MLSISEKNGIDLLEEKDINILYVGVSTAGAAEIEMLKKIMLQNKKIINQNKIIIDLLKKQGEKDD